jgi:hypothetical protein
VPFNQKADGAARSGASVMNTITLTEEMVEHYRAVMDGDIGAGDPDSDDVIKWLAERKIQPATSTSPMPARALRAGR